MPNRLTLKSTHRPDQAADPEDEPSQTSGQQPLQKLQDVFLTDMLDRIVTVYLVNGIKLVGKVRQFDQYTLLLQQTDDIDSLSFKHAISTVIPGGPVMTRERRTPFGKRPEGTG